MREELRKELRAARLHFATGDATEAERHIRNALKLIDAGPMDGLRRAVRGYIAEAGFAITQDNARLAASAIDEAISALDEEPSAEEG